MANCQLPLAIAHEYNKTNPAVTRSTRPVSAQIPRYLASIRLQISATASARTKITKPCEPQAMLLEVGELNPHSR